MAVRNFWVRTEVDGRKNILASGPRSRGGGFRTDILMRDKGGKALPVEIYGFAMDDGKLELSIRIKGPASIIVNGETKELPDGAELRVEKEW